jgi:hypothetical protein
MRSANDSCERLRTTRFGCATTSISMKLENQLRDTSTTRTIISGFTRASATFHPPNSRELQQPFLTLAQLNHLYQKWAHHPRSIRHQRTASVPISAGQPPDGAICPRCQRRRRAPSSTRRTRSRASALRLQTTRDFAQAGRHERQYQARLTSLS